MEQQLDIEIKKSTVFREVRKTTEYYAQRQGKYEILSLFPAMEEMFNKFWQEACRALDLLLSIHLGLTTVIGGKYTTDDDKVKEEYTAGVLLPDNYPLIVSYTIPSLCTTFLIDDILAAWINLCGDKDGAKLFTETVENDALRLRDAFLRREEVTAKTVLQTDGEATQIS